MQSPHNSIETFSQMDSIPNRHHTNECDRKLEKRGKREKERKDQLNRMEKRKMYVYHK